MALAAESELPLTVPVTTLLGDEPEEQARMVGKIEHTKVLRMGFCMMAGLQARRVPGVDPTSAQQGHRGGARAEIQRR
jgi:hypothetical protein